MAEDDTVAIKDVELSELIVGVNKEDGVSVFTRDSEICRLLVCSIVNDEIVLVLGVIKGLALKELVELIDSAFVNEFSELGLGV